MEKTLKNISRALSAAGSALSADNDGEAARASELYMEAVDILEGEQPNVPAEQQRVMRSYSDSYQERATHLAASIVAAPVKQAAARHVAWKELDLPLTQTEAARKALCATAPCDIDRQACWQMRLIRQSITAGGFITPQLHVPPAVWQQSGAKIQGLAFKETSFAQFSAGLERLRACGEKPHGPSGMSAFKEQLKMLCQETIQIQNNLSRPFPFIPEVADGTREAAPTSADDGSKKQDWQQVCSSFRASAHSRARLARTRTPLISLYSAGIRAVCHCSGRVRTQRQEASHHSRRARGSGCTNTRRCELPAPAPSELSTASTCRRARTY